MNRFATSAVAACALLVSTQAFGSLIVTVPAHSHPNGNWSANENAVDSRDYGLRLDNNGNVNTFHFESVAMSFFSADGPADQNTIYATLSGTIAHLQSSHNGVLGYNSTSGLDAEDQRYEINAQFRVISRTGTWGGGQGVPYADMLTDLLAAPNGAGQINFALHDLVISPIGNAIGNQIYDGPTILDERPGTESSPNAGAFYIEKRHRLTAPAFAGPEWDVLGAAGWLEPAVDGNNNGQGRDYLFYLDPIPDVPEPGTLMLLSLAGVMAVRRKAQA